jgi:hypothetical protein
LVGDGYVLCTVGSAARLVEICTGREVETIKFREALAVDS